MHILVMGWWKVLGKIIGSFVFTLYPIQVKLPLCYVILDSMIPYVKGLRPLYADLGLKDVMGS